MLKEVTVSRYSFIEDQDDGSPIMLLRSVEGEEALPIWIGAYECCAIQTELAGMNPPRPMTVDLFRNYIIGKGEMVTRAVVTRLEEGTFYAELALEGKDGISALDCRPSDAVALAIRFGSRIFVDDGLFQPYRENPEYAEYVRKLAEFAKNAEENYED